MSPHLPDFLSQQPCIIRIFLGDTPDSDSLWLNSASCLETIGSSLRDACTKNLLPFKSVEQKNIEQIQDILQHLFAHYPLKISSAHQQAVKTGIYSGQDDQCYMAGYSYRLPHEAQQIINTLEGKSLGHGHIQIHAHFDQSTVNFDAKITLH